MTGLCLSAPERGGRPFAEDGPIFNGETPKFREPVTLCDPRNICVSAITAFQCRVRETKSPHPHVFAGAYAQDFSAASPEGPLRDADVFADFLGAERPVGVFG
jgi:hypothetical protein